MIEVRVTDEFARWRADLRDWMAALRVTKRIAKLKKGNFGDSKSVGGTVSELRIHYGPGYRLYFTRRGAAVVILLCGGHKSTQPHDIERARVLAAEID